MKALSYLVTAVGVIIVVLAFVGLLIKGPVFGVSSQGYLRGAPALFLLSLNLIAFDQFYHGKEKKK